MINALKVALFFGFGFFILYLVYQKQDAAYQEECILQGIAAKDCSLIDKVILDIKSTRILWLVIVLFAFMVSNLFRALRWNQMINALGYYPRLINSFGTIMIAYFANLGLPRSGEVLRPLTLSKYEDIPFEKLMGTLVIERAIDVIMFALFICLALLIEGDTIWTYLIDNGDFGSKFGFLSSLWFWLVVVSCLIGLFLFSRSKEGSVFGKLWRKIITFLEGLKEGLLSVMHLKNPKLFIGYTVGIWIMYYLMTYLCFFSFDPTSLLGPLEALVVFVFGTMGFVIPSPGGMGTYHFLVNESLTLYGISQGDGFSFANIVFFSVQIFGNVVFGIISLIFLPIYNRKK